MSWSLADSIHAPLLSPKIKPGDLVRIHYQSFSSQDCLIETSENREPLEFVAGSQQVIAGVSRAVVGMKVSERKRVTVNPEHAFGQRNPGLQQTVPRSSLPDRIQEGDQLSVTVNGQRLDVWVKTVQGDEAVLDSNHPLVGETLVFEIEVVGIGTGSEQERINHVD